MSKLSDWLKRKKDEAGKEWQDTLKSKEDALGRPLSEELVSEAKEVGKLAVGLSKAVGGPDLTTVSEVINMSENGSTGASNGFSIQTMVSKGVKTGVQVLVSVIMASHVVSVVLQNNPDLDPKLVTLVLLGVITSLVEMLRNVVKQKVPLLASLL